ncbi:DUF624 domain-containing protein [Clostridium akagii]|uniref:DUF624 domain-containing protein n=1 Tax=Clostridium akagii TaxID=91623 RepID=UPI00047B206F|nr:DUF624 domain-containing protein [Clostridium akagii]
MFSKKEFDEGVIYTIFNYIWWFLLGSFYFALTNILFIFVCWIINAQGISYFNLITIISLLPTGPALVALFSVMGKIVRENDVNMTKDFFKAYRKNFSEALFYWSSFLAILIIIYADIVYLNANVQLISAKFILIAVKFILITAALILISITFYVLPIISRFYFRKKDVMKISFYYVFKKIHITILNWICLIGLSYLSIEISSSILIFFFSSALCYLIIFNEKSILMSLEEKCPSLEDRYISTDKIEK